MEQEKKESTARSMWNSLKAALNDKPLCPFCTKVPLPENTQAWLYGSEEENCECKKESE